MNLFIYIYNSSVLSLLINFCTDTALYNIYLSTDKYIHPRFAIKVLKHIEHRKDLDVP